MSEPFLLPGGPTGCLLVHGFTGGPYEMRDLGEHLALAGHTVFGVRLPGHGGPPEDLAVVPRGDWLAAVAGGLAYLRSRCSQVFVVGFSLGGALSLLLSARHPVDRLVLLSTPLRLQGDWRVNLIGLLRHTIPWHYPFAQADFRDPEIRAQINARAPQVNLDDPAVQTQLRTQIRISVAAADELRRTLIQARTALPQVRAPALVMHGRADVVSPLDSAETIIAAIGSPTKDLIWWDQTGHQLLTVGPHRQAIFERVAAFLQ